MCTEYSSNPYQYGASVMPGDIRLSNAGQTNIIAARSDLSYNSETWPLDRYAKNVGV